MQVARREDEEEISEICWGFDFFALFGISILSLVLLGDAKLVEGERSGGRKGDAHDEFARDDPAALRS